MTNDFSGEIFRRALGRMEEEEGAAFSLRAMCFSVGGEKGPQLYQSIVKVSGGITKTVKKEVIQLFRDKYPKFGIFFDEEKAKLASGFDARIKDPRLAFANAEIQANDAHILNSIQRLEDKSATLEEIIILLTRRISNVEKQIKEVIRGSD